MSNSIEVNQLSKRYRKGRGSGALRDLFGYKGRNAADQFHWALRDVTFAVQPGEALGIIGPNGAGKTTLLKILSNVTRPTSGNVKVNGRLSALIELGAGFHPDLTGRENIYLNGKILGLTGREIDKRFDAIVAFSELEDFLDMPVKRYSSGMYARLGFSVAAHIEPDIMLVDEVLSVGDTSFQAKSFQRMQMLKEQGTTLVFVSHNMQAVKRVCTQAIVLLQGQVAYEGAAAAAVGEYTDLVRSSASVDARPNRPEAGGLKQLAMTHGAKIKHVRLLSADGEIVRVVRPGDEIRVLVDVDFLENAAEPVFACTLYNERGDLIYDTTTQWQGQQTPNFQAGDQAQIAIQLSANLLNGSYTIKVDLAYTDLSCYYDYVAQAASFVVDGGYEAQGEANLFGTFAVTRVDGGRPEESTSENKEAISQ